MANAERDLAISAAPASVTAFIGSAPAGPTDRAVLVGSWVDYERTFGGLEARSLLGYGVSHFFANGGAQAWILRLSDGAAAIDGLPLLDRIDHFNLLCVPGLSQPALLVQLAAYCRGRRAFLIADCAAGDSVATLRNGGAVWTGDAAMNAALYFPWITLADPLQQNRPRDFPPSGAVAGIYARTDASRGIAKAPAGTQATITGALGVKTSMRDVELMTLNDAGVNGIRALPGQGVTVWGARTRSGIAGGGSDWRYVPVRRTALFIEDSLTRGLEWTRLEPNNETLWAAIRGRVGDFMTDLFRQGTFQGRTSREAFYVKCGPETTTQRDIERGVVDIVIGFAPLKPAEFVVITLRQLAAGAGQ